MSHYTQQYLHFPKCSTPQLKVTYQAHIIITSKGECSSQGVHNQMCCIHLVGAPHSCAQLTGCYCLLHVELGASLWGYEGERGTSRAKHVFRPKNILYKQLTHFLCKDSKQVNANEIKQVVSHELCFNTRKKHSNIQTA